MLENYLGFALGRQPRSYEPDLIAPPQVFNDLPIGSPPRPPGLIGPEDGDRPPGSGGGSFNTGEGEEV